jgi:hypothetical protein
MNFPKRSAYLEWLQLWPVEVLKVKPAVLPHVLGPE